MATKLGQNNPWCKLYMMMTSTNVECQLRSNKVNYALWTPNLVRRTPDVSLRWWPHKRSKVKRSKEVKYAIWLPNLSRRTSWFELEIMMTSKEVKGQQKSNEVKYTLWLPNRCRRTFDANLGWWYLDRGQRSTGAKWGIFFFLWLSHYMKKNPLMQV